MNLSGNELARNLSGNTRKQSSQLAEPLWTDPGIKSGISVREIIAGEHSPSILAREEKAIVIVSPIHVCSTRFGLEC